MTTEHHRHALSPDAHQRRGFVRQEAIVATPRQADGDIAHALIDLTEKVTWAHDAKQARRYRKRQDEILDAWLARQELTDAVGPKRPPQDP